MPPRPSYRGRLAPSPTGLLHLGHARTFWTAHRRARERNGMVVLRNEDLDPARCRPEFTEAMMEDLRWLGLDWDEGPDCGGSFGPYEQSRAKALYRAAFERLRESGFLYPCACSRRDIRQAMSAPHWGEEEPIYPGTCRPGRSGDAALSGSTRLSAQGRPPSWRFLVPAGRTVRFVDGHLGPQSLVAGRDFGDFVVWRHDDVPSYQLAVVTDDARMAVSEVVRGADLLISTARQILLYEALKERIPAFYHCDLMLDDHGRRLAKRHAALSVRTLREKGMSPEEVRRLWEGPSPEPLLPGGGSKTD